MFKKILVALDLTEASVIAWKQANVLAKSFGSKVEGLYVQKWLYSMAGLSPAEPLLTANATRGALARLQTKLGTKAEIRAATGDVEEIILAWGKYLNYDLVVLGTHGRTGIERLLKGSVAETVLRHSSVPVLVVKRLTPRFKTVLAPVNLESHSLEALGSAARVAAAFGARLTILHAIETPLYGDAQTVRGPREGLVKAIARIPKELREACAPEIRVVAGRAIEEIAAAAERADLVVLAAHRRGLLADTVLGTTAERVLRHCSSPVLAVPTGVPALKRAAAI